MREPGYNKFYKPGSDGGGGPHPHNDFRPIEPYLAESADGGRAVIDGVVGDHEGEGGVEEDVGDGDHGQREEDGTGDGLVRLLRFVPCFVFYLHFVKV